MKQQIGCLAALFLVFCATSEAASPPLKPWDVPVFYEQLREAHVSAQKEVSPALAQRIIAIYLDQLDGSKCYLLAGEVEQWLQATPEMLNQLCQSYNKWQYPHFEQLDQLMAQAIERRNRWTPSSEKIALSKSPDANETLVWAVSEKELFDRWQVAHQRLQEAVSQLSTDGLENRIARRRSQWEERFVGSDQEEMERARLVRILKASAGALDDHTAYLTPQEAKVLQIDMEQKLVGIGIQLRDDLELGFTVMRLLENGPAERSGEILVGDRIVAVGGENVVGWEVDTVVEKIRGQRGTPVQMTFLREKEEALETVQVKLTRDEVIFEGKQCETRLHPFGKGVIAVVALHSFYGDNQGRSSTHDVEAALKQLSKEQQLLGIVLDLRQNGGGLLGEALSVAALFEPKGAAVLVQDPAGKPDKVTATAQEAMYKGPLIVLTSRVSASGAEIVAQALQEQGRALVVGDDHTFGKGSYQVLSSQLIGNRKINPKGEFKVTRGCYYTLSGRTPQLTGVVADIVVPSPVANAEVGERWSHYPLSPEPMQLSSGFVPAPPHPLLDQLKANSTVRLDQHPTYSALVKESGSNQDREQAEYLLTLQLEEALSIMKDILILREDRP